MDRNERMEQLYQVLMFATNILDYQEKLESMKKEIEQLKEKENAVRITRELVAEYKVAHKEANEGEILPLVNRELTVKMSRLDLNINVMKKNIEKLNQTSSQILEEVLLEGDGSLGIPKDEIEESYINEYMYILSDLKVAGESINQEMLFDSPSTFSDWRTEKVKKASGDVSDDQQKSQDSLNEGEEENTHEDESMIDEKVDVEEDDFEDDVSENAQY